MELESLPTSASKLERYRILTRRQSRPGLVGGHLMRRKGQGLEFHDFRPYLPGDDIRHVDWRASARHGNANDLLIRTFTAEEQLTLIISLDTRESMELPVAMPKGQIAAWLAEAVGRIALRSDDRVILHRLFGGPGGSIEELRGSGANAAMGKILRRFYSHPPDTATLPPASDPPPNLGVLQRYLRPAVVWLIISDLYFDMDTTGRRLGSRIAGAQDGMRWIILVDTDSWPHEKIHLGQGARKIEGPGLDTTEKPLEIDPNTIDNIEHRMHRHKELFRQGVGRDGFDYIHWKWPEEQHPDGVDFFETHFGNDRVLRRLFMKENDLAL